MPKISELPTGTTLTGVEQIAAVQSTVTNKITPTQLSAFSRTNNGVVSVKDYGAVGDGVTDDKLAIRAAVDAAFGTAASPNGTANVTLNKILYFPPGHYITSGQITFTRIQGARVLGAGRFVSKVENTSAGQIVFAINGAGYCHFEGIYLKSTATGYPLNLDWDGVAGGASLQSNTFMDMFFHDGSIGVNIAGSGFMGSENIFINCYWLGCDSGIYTATANAAQNTVIGGNIQGCTNGIEVGLGSVPFIAGVGFQEQLNYDILISGAANDCYQITGCRTESANFISHPGAADQVFVSGCVQKEAIPADGVFLSATGVKMTHIDSCFSGRGQIITNGGCRVTISNYKSTRAANWLSITSATSATNIEIENVIATGETINRQRRTSAGTYTYPLYTAGIGGAVTQITSRTTGVTLNTLCGAITLVSAAGSATAATFTVTNSTVVATDTVIVTQKSGTDLYRINVTAVAAGSFNITFNTTGGTTTEQPVFNFAVVKAVAA